MAEGKGKGVWGLRETIKQARFFFSLSRNDL